MKEVFWNAEDKIVSADPSYPNSAKYPSLHQTSWEEPVQDNIKRKEC